MVVLHLVALTKLKLLAAAAHGGSGPGQLVAALLGPFVLKIPFRRYVPGAFRDVVFSSRLFLFRLSRILFFEDYRRPVVAADNTGRWERALRLFFEISSDGDGRPRLAIAADEASLHEVSMVAL